MSLKKHSPPDSEEEKKSIKRLLRFKPDGVSVILALLVWAVILGSIAILITVGLSLGRYAFADEWEPALTHPSSILIGKDDPHIRLIPEEEKCRIRSLSNGGEQLLCDVPFEGASLALNVELEDGIRWHCSAEYDGQPVPCRASFDSQDYETYIVVQSDLGLSEERSRKLLEDTMNIGWGERELIWLASGIVTISSLAAFVLLWRNSGKNANDRSTTTIVLRAAYSAVISLMIFVVANYVSFVVLLAFNLID